MAGKSFRDDEKEGRSFGEQAYIDDESIEIEIELGGRRCSIVRVDGVMPQHNRSNGSKGVRLTYVNGEIAHFEFKGHRYALRVELDDVDIKPSTGTEPEKETAILDLLTNRELQIVQLVCLGYLNKQIADRLRISEFTVRTYLKAVFAKFGVRSRAAMVCRYMQACGGTPADPKQQK